MRALKQEEVWTSKGISRDSYLEADGSPMPLTTSFAERKEKQASDHRHVLLQLKAEILN